MLRRYPPLSIVMRMSDFKINVYVHLIGGKEFEPVGENPMLKFGALLFNIAQNIKSDSDDIGS